MEVDGTTKDFIISSFKYHMKLSLLTECKLEIDQTFQKEV